MIVAALLCVAASAQRAKFDPAKFEADLEQFVSTEARLTPAEAAAFFPLYREMREKQMAYFNNQRRMDYTDCTDDRACAEAIRRRDDSELEIKRLQQQYHERFMRVIPASKVYRVLKAEDKFHRQLFKRAHAGDRRTHAGGSKQGK